MENMNRLQGVRPVETEKTQLIRVDFYFGGHGTAKEAQDFLELCAGADVIALENLGWSKETQQIIQRCVDGKIPNGRKVSSSYAQWSETVLKMLYGTKKVMISVDVPEGSLANKLNTLSRECDQLEEQGGDAFLSGHFDDSIRIIKDVAKKSDALHTEREERIVHNINNILHRLPKLYPQLKAKEEIRVLIFFGSGHVRIYEEFMKAVPEEQRDRVHMILKDPGLASEQIREHMRRGEHVDEILYPRVNFNNILLSVFAGTPLEDRSVELIKVLGKAFTFDELKDISLKFGSAPPTKIHVQKVIQDALDHKGIEFPKSIKDADRIIAEMET